MYILKNLPSEITYLQISDRAPFQSPLLPPVEFDNEVVNFISKCPMDILQLDSKDIYQEFKMSSSLFKSINFRFIYSDYAINFIKDNLEKNKILLFLIDYQSELKTEIVEFLKLSNNKLWFIYFFNFNNENTSNSLLAQEIHSPVEFMIRLIEENVEIAKVLNMPDLNLSPSMPIDLKIFNFEDKFSISMLNTKILCDIFSNYGYENNFSNEESIALQANLGKEAIVNKNSYNRIHSALEIINKIDAIYYGLVKDGIKPINSQFDPILAPLILVAPFHSPDMSKLKLNKGDDKMINDMIGIWTSEQSNNYTFDFESKYTPESLSLGFSLLKRKTSSLDDLSYLHSTFTQSPILRLPLKGRSINRELSFFRPQMHASLANTKNRNKIIRTIAKLGKSLNTSLLSDKTRNFLKERNRQLILLSDLPLEWLSIEEIPLAYSHDVCRIPETSHATIMAQFMSNSTHTFEIDENIINKTIVICGSNEDSFLKWQKIALESQVELGYNFEICLSILEVKKAIEKYTPELLIFDCHGGIDESTSNTFLWVGDEELSGDEIISNNISAPLVFLSACGTSPSYGLYNSIANAFFETGTIAVTATYLPILVDSGSILYLRILHLLNHAAREGLHMNWLSFISHAIRTSQIHEAYKGLPLDSDKEINEKALILTKSMDFNQRRKLYKELDETLKSLTGTANKFTQGVPEYLFYTNLGRADLVLFKKWNEKILEKVKTQ